MEQRQLLALARLTRIKTKLYTPPPVPNVTVARTLFKRACKVLSSGKKMSEKYLAAADAHAASNYAEDADYSLELQREDLASKTPIASYQAVFKRKAQFKKVSEVLELCGTELPASLLPVRCWYEPQIAASEALTFLKDSLEGAEIIR
ncbi:2279_t:CDS:1 [Paraglomus brasilianum]|uniref:2279_t:CDS:1 n=1 Tax=Paraglomus brasilianum TaxID=144538 RepID=A0A9N8WD47_9GLOM|nr:2279_t:CDS:1 [Paraglomus brasilianum]